MNVAENLKSRSLNTELYSTVWIDEEEGVGYSKELGRHKGVLFLDDTHSHITAVLKNREKL